jgi:hypothetical protein
MPHDMHSKCLTTLALYATVLIRLYKRPANQATRLVKTQTLSKRPLPLPALLGARNHTILTRWSNTTLRLIAMKGQTATVRLKHL